MTTLPERLLAAAEILEGIGGQSALAATVREAATALQPSAGGEVVPDAWLWICNGKPVNAFLYKPGEGDPEHWQPKGYSAKPLYLASPAQADAWPAGVLNRADTLDLLTSHNAWRRGAGGPQTDPRRLGLALDAAIAYITAAPSAPRGLGVEGG